jgi:Flp pilus assembly protein TadG
MSRLESTADAETRPIGRSSSIGGDQVTRAALKGVGQARSGREERGAAVVEFAFVIPVLAALVFGIIEFGFAFNSQLEIRSASREGARLAVVDNGCSGNACSGQSASTRRDNIISATRSKASGLASVNNVKISVSCSNAPSDCSALTASSIGTATATVCLNYTLQSVTGLFAPILNNKTLSSKATMRLEAVPTFASGADSAGAATCA